MSDSGICNVCNKINTPCKDDDGNFICVNCSNGRYIEKLRNGVIIELRIDMRKVKQSTLTLIKSLIQKDEENYAVQASVASKAK